MSEDKPQKPMPTAAEINAYLEKSAARTRMRLPLAKGQIFVQRSEAAPTDAAKAPPQAVPASATRKLPLQALKKRPTSAENDDGEATPAAKEGGWQPFGSKDE